MSAHGDRGLNLALDAAFEVSLLSNRVRRQYRLPHSVRDEIQRLALRVMAGLQGHDLVSRETLTAEDAEAVLAAILGALRERGVGREAIVAVVNRWAMGTAGPVDSTQPSAISDQGTGP